MLASLLPRCSLRPTLLRRCTRSFSTAAGSASSSSSSGSATLVGDSAPQRPHLGVAVTVLRQIPPPPIETATGEILPGRPRPAVATQWEVLLVRRSKAPLSDWWALPGGSVELGETLQKAGVREVKEETGLSIYVKRHPDPFFVSQYIEPSSSTPSGAAAGSKGHYVLAHLLADYPLPRAAGSGGDQVAVAGDDAAEVRWFPVPGLNQSVIRQQLAAKSARMQRRKEKADVAEHQEEEFKASKEEQADMDALGMEKPADTSADANSSDPSSAPATAAAAPSSATGDAAVAAPATPPRASTHPLIIPMVARVVRDAVALRRKELLELELKEKPRGRMQGQFGGKAQKSATPAWKHKGKGKGKDADSKSTPR